MDEPHVNSVDPQSNPDAPPTETPQQSNVIPQVPPPIQSNKETAHCKPDQTPTWKMILETAAVFVGLYVAGIYHSQLVVMQGQLGELIRQYPELQKSAQAAKDSVDLTRKTAHFDQRSWLGISYGTYRYTIGQVFSIAYRVTDTGKTPARNVHGKTVTRFMHSGDIPLFDDKHGTTVDLGTMLPNVQQKAISWLVVPDSKQPAKITPDMFHVLHNGGYMMIYGTINYDSVFGAHHWIKFCATSGPSFYSVPQQCIDYNDVDGNDEP